MTEREWDSQDSTDYHDGYEQAEADLRDGKPYDDHAGSKPAPWTEGYQDAAGRDDTRSQPRVDAPPVGR